MTSTLWARERLERERIHKRSDVSPVFLGAWRALKENRYIHKDTEMYDRSFWAHDESPEKEQRTEIYDKVSCAQALERERIYLVHNTNRLQSTKYQVCNSGM